MKVILHVGVVVFVGSVSTLAAADDKATCLEASLRGQTMRNGHQLVEAREQFRVCARATCPALVQKDCGNWLDAVEAALPSVVVSAKNAAGADLVDVRVSADGRPLLEKLDGMAVSIDPGQHLFHFEGPDGSQDELVVVKEGEQHRSVAAILGPTGAGHPSEAHGGSTWKTIGWVVGAVGVAGLGVGAALGVVAAGDTSSAHCNANNQCLAGPLADARSAARGSDVGFVAGGILLAGGAALVLFAPTGSPVKHGMGMNVLPLVGLGGGGVAVGGSW